MQCIANRFFDRLLHLKAECGLEAMHWNMLRWRTRLPTAAINFTSPHIGLSGGVRMSLQRVACLQNFPSSLE